MRRWERKKSGFYQYINRTKRYGWGNGYEEGILAEVARGADGLWWMEYLDKKQGWVFKRCRSYRNAQAVAEECC
jgi:hypothetical protein